jgi:hypothetical protein
MFETLSARWIDLFNRILQRPGPTNALIWRRTWGGALILCFLCTFLRGTADVSHEWIEYLPSGFISEVVLTFLSLRLPLSTEVPFWRLAIFPIAGVWLPFACQVLSSLPLELVRLILEKLIGWGGFPRLATPWAYGHGLLNASTCIVMTVIVTCTAFLIGAKHAVATR